MFCGSRTSERESHARVQLNKVLASGQIVGLANHTVLVARDGHRYTIADSGAPIKDLDGQIIGVVLVFRDITAQQRTEAELLKMEKLKSIGVLAGGIAHDFNNFLTGIIGNLSLAKLDAQPGERHIEVPEGYGKSSHAGQRADPAVADFFQGRGA
jgi:two-component system cell cycle sensor histidine kinase/response regulator CckA